MAEDNRSGQSIGQYSVKLEEDGGKSVSKQSGSKKKAIMFVPEGADVKDYLDIEVVALDAATFEAMGPRRC
ncbi:MULTISPECIES: hypothetical protein [Xanthobacter]|uniref:hypothetical protein n=1 Tax=Xanthobacter TaxID=279 RepID=UPI001EDFBFFB|nr:MULTISPECIES: hypothetical protein [unclassified Xanthobacter]